MRIAWTLQRKITTGILLILLATLVLSGVLILEKQRHQLMGALTQQAERLTSLVAKFSVHPLEKYSYFILEEVALSVGQFPQVAFCEIYDANGNSLTNVETTIRGKNIKKKQRQTGDNILVAARKITSDSGTLLGEVEIGIFTDSVKSKLRMDALTLAVGSLLIVILVAASLHLFLARSIITPVVTLSSMAQSLSRGEFVKPDLDTRRDEIGDLFHAFNRMSSNLQHLYSNLENEVKERTSELEGANRLLQIEITEREKVKEALKKAKEEAEIANQYKSIFVANMSHEIRTPMNAILGYAQILQQKQLGDPDTIHAVNTIEKSGSHLLEVINEILDFSKIEAGKVDLRVAPFDLAALLSSLDTLFALRCKEKKLTWEVIGPKDRTAIPVEGDQGKLRQVLINLLSNAVKFTDTGRVSLRVKETAPDLFHLEVQDTGPGIPEDLQQMIFQPFRQVHNDAREDGTGLGLSISNSYVQLMGGRLELASNEGVGCRFHFSIRLPQVPVESVFPDDPAPAIRQLSKAQSIHAMVVDDDRNSREMLSSILTGWGFSVTSADNGRDALEQLESQPVDILFVDYHMPMMDGLALARDFRRRTTLDAIPTVLVSADVFDLHDQISREKGIDHCIAKPLRIEAIAAVVEKRFPRQFKAVQPPPPATGPAIDETPFAIPLPEGMRTQIQEAAQFGQVSELKQIIEKLNSMGDRHEKLGTAMAHRLRKYDMDGIIKLMTNTPKGEIHGES